MLKLKPVGHVLDGTAGVDRLVGFAYRPTDFGLEIRSEAAQAMMNGRAEVDAGTLWPDLGAIRAKGVSYAQNFEDVRLARVFPRAAGCYIDVGAYEPVFHSVTKLFYDRGWRGVNVEPQPLIFGRLAADRPEDINLNAGVSDRAGAMNFFEIPDRPGLSTFDPRGALASREEGLRVIEREVKVLTLAELCERHVGTGREIDFLKVDAEGFEREVLNGGDWKKWRPRVVLVEAEMDACASMLVGFGYEFTVFDGINRFYVREEDRALGHGLRVPISALDDVIPYTYLRLIEERADLGPTTLKVARRLRRLAGRFPWLSAVARRWLGSINS